MSLTKFLKDIRYHQSNEDKPVMTAQQLKELFDQAGIDIKEYINETLTNELDNEFRDIRMKMMVCDKLNVNVFPSDVPERIIEFPYGFKLYDTCVNVMLRKKDESTNDQYREQYNDWTIHNNNGGTPYLKIKNVQEGQVYSIDFIKLNT